MKIEQAADQPAPAALLAHIRASEHASIPAFCEAKGLDRLKVQKAINGKIKWMDLKFAFEIEKATDGAVAASSWIPEAETEQTATDAEVSS